jgi:UDP-2,3-diacylglucosamine hydrolase
MLRVPIEHATLAPPVYFVSDAHLGAEPEPIASTQLERLVALIQKVRNENGALVINGDLFDFWYEWQSVIPKKYFKILRTLQQATESGTRIHLLAGNHDFRLKGFLESEIGMVTHQDGLAVQIASSQVFVFHGDGVLKSDHGYRVLKKVLRSPISQRLFLWLHPDLGMLLARGTSQQSRNATKGNSAEDADYREYAEHMLSNGYSGVVMGHAHRPVEEQIAGGTYINLGDWIYHYSYAVHDGSNLRLLKWEDTAGAAR